MGNKPLHQFRIHDVGIRIKAGKQTHADGQEDVRQVLCLHSEAGVKRFGLPLQAKPESQSQNRCRKQASPNRKRRAIIQFEFSAAAILLTMQSISSISCSQNRKLLSLQRLIAHLLECLLNILFQFWQPISSV